jgi:arginase family enzyme
VPELARAVPEGTARRIALLGCPLDADEREPTLEEKIALLGKAPARDPYEGVLEHVRMRLPSRLIREAGIMDVPAWLRSIPRPADRRLLNVRRFVDFIDSGGCLEWAERIASLAEGLHPDIPFLIASDHSMAGGLMKAAARRHSPQAVTFVVLDSHTDAVPMEVASGLIDYDAEKNPHSPFDRADPYLRGRSESYNAGTFLLWLLKEGVIKPQHLIIIGASDAPPKRATRIKDGRVERFVQSYDALIRSGVKVLTKEDVVSSPSKVKAVLGSIKTPYLYLSIDMDIGAGNATRAVRFRERTGLNERQIMALVRQAASCLSSGIRLAGLDLCEFNPREPSLAEGTGKDRAFEIAASIIEEMAIPALAA